MDGDSKKKEEALFYAALKLATQDARGAYLRKACGGDEELLGRVQALLAADEAPDRFLEEPPGDLGLSVDYGAPTEGAGSVIGRYKLLERIGEGGMAVVYMAEQSEPIRRKVAMKIIKLGMDTKQVIARFEAERQALAMMDHPNIAKVFDAGATETGRPYFVMELVTGVSITEYCDANHLNTKERLTLFMQVCSAIQHAHQKGIIHRDIKPSNVMVTMHDGKPVPKVIDFGIAKATNQRLTEKTLFTRYAQIIGTPAYMSPEQAELSDVDIDTRSDIYSLGVLLYELLAGTSPFSEQQLREAGYLEMQRVIREEEPTRPSTKLSTLGDSAIDIAKRRSCSPDLLRKTLRGDLDWIVMKSLEKDRTRRYDTAAAFLSDIQHHLNCEPVSAGPPSAWYRTRKFIQRRRGLVIAGLAVLIVVLTALLVSTWMYLQADRARSETQLVSDFFTDDFLSSVFPEKAKGQQVTLRYILDHATKNISMRLEASPLSEAKVRETIGLAYQKLGDYKDAESHLQRALQIRRQRLGADDPATLASFDQLGGIYTLQGEYQKAEEVLQTVLGARERLLGEEHPDTLESMTSLAELYVYRARLDAAYPLVARVLEIGARVLGDEHPVVLKAMLEHAYIRVFGFESDRAYSLASKGLEIGRRVLGEEHETTLGFMSALVCACRQKECYDEGKALSARALEIGRRVFGEEHMVTMQAMSQLGDLYVIEGRYDEAAPLLTGAVELGRRVLGQEHVWTLFFMMRLVRLYEAQGQYDEMEALVIEALEICLRMKADPVYFEGKLRQRIGQRRLAARECYNAGEYGNALEILTRLRALRESLGNDDAVTQPSETSLLAMSLHRLGHDQEARSELSRLRLVCEQGTHLHEESYLYEAEQVLAPNGSEVRRVWGLIQGRELEAASEAVERLRIAFGDDDPNDNIQTLTRALARAYCMRGNRAACRGKYEEAITDYELSIRMRPGFACAHDRLANLLSICQVERVRDGGLAVEHAIKACELTQWKNASYVATLAAAHAEAGDFNSAVECQRQAIELLAQDERKGFRGRYEMRLGLYESEKPYHRSMVARWTFDRSDGETVADISGNGLNGTLVGDAHIVEDVDRPGMVLCLDGEGDWVDCGNDVRLDIVGEITITCWAKVHKFNKTHQIIISKGKSTWGLARFGDTNTIAFVCSGVAVRGDQYGLVHGMVNVNDGQWHHLVGVYDGMRMGLYIDGKLDVSSEASGYINVDSCRVLIGENDTVWGDEGRDKAFNGLLDDVRVYDYALTEAEIVALYRAEETGMQDRMAILSRERGLLRR